MMNENDKTPSLLIGLQVPDSPTRPHASRDRASSYGIANPKFKSANPATLLMAEKLRDAVIGIEGFIRKKAESKGKQEPVQPEFLQKAATNPNTAYILQHLADVLF